ncbi:MAG: MoaD/ThiS family protein [Anaerolineae bacterium]|nr:MoaD/ThiS family protein [Anaerolineae bacterium]
MPAVKFTTHLEKFFPGVTSGVRVEAQTVAEVVTALDQRFPGLAAYLVDEQGALRKHVNIFVDDDLIHDRQKLSDPITDSNRVYIFQALSGG